MTVPSTLFSRRTVLGAAASLAALSAFPARAALRVDITGVGANQIPVAITVNQPADAPQDIASASSTLRSSGRSTTTKSPRSFPRSPSST